MIDTLLKTLLVITALASVGTVGYGYFVQEDIQAMMAGVATFVFCCVVWWTILKDDDDAS
jgi:hypothetical protein